MKISAKILPILFLSVFLGVSIRAKPLVEDEIIINDLENNAEYEERFDDSNELAKEDKANEDALIEAKNVFFTNEEVDKDSEESVSEEKMAEEDDDSGAKNGGKDSEEEQDETIIDEESVEQPGDDDEDIENEEGDEKDIDVEEDEVKNIDVEEDEEILDEKANVNPKEPPVAWHEKVRRYFANWGK